MKNKYVYCILNRSATMYKQYYIIVSEQMGAWYLFLLPFLLIWSFHALQFSPGTDSDICFHVGT
jgi:hypothetical protein